MASTTASQLLRPGLLRGVTVVLARPSRSADAGESLAGAVGAACAGLGARVCDCELDRDRPPELGAGADATEATEAAEAAEAAADRALAAAGEVQLLAVDAAGLFAAGAAGAAPGADASTVGAAGASAPASGEREDPQRRGLRSCLQDSWKLTRALAARAFLPGGRGGRIVYLAPPADAGAHARAARAGLENLARTLSVEWARHAVTVVTIAPGDSSARAAGEAAALTAYLASPAGAYFSGCLLDLSAARPAGADLCGPRPAGADPSGPRPAGG